MFYIELFLSQLTNILYDVIKLYLHKLYSLQIKIIFQSYSFQKSDISIEICDFALSLKHNGSNGMWWVHGVEAWFINLYENLIMPVQYNGFSSFLFWNIFHVLKKINFLTNDLNNFILLYEVCFSPISSAKCSHINWSSLRSSLTV